LGKSTIFQNLVKYNTITERRVEAGRVLWRASGQTPLLKQGHVDPAAQEHVQMAFAYLQGWRLHHLSGQPVAVLGHPHSEKVFPDVQTGPPMFQCVPIASGSVTGHC